MAAMIVITCPECKKQLKGPADLQGKRVRCKACGQVFAVRSPPPSKSAPGPSKVSVPAAQAKTATPVPAPPEADKEKNPYQLSDIVVTNRCPQCAAELESPEAVICLNCGYNSLSRERMTTIRTYAHTPLDWTLWLAPGILCALAVLALIGLICFLLIPAGLQRVAGDAWWGHFSIQIYGSFVAAGVAWFVGKFAFRRLVQNPRPPEKFKRAIDE
jgi:DNA-directed RNA polymerase subunit RPC12/RpoP